MWFLSVTGIVTLSETTAINICIPEHQYNMSNTTMCCTFLQISDLSGLSAVFEAVRQNSHAAKRKRSDSEDSQAFILQIGQCMIQQSEATTRLQERMVKLMQPKGPESRPCTLYQYS